jgi:hypothetical protein
MVAHITLGWPAFWLTAISLMAVSCRFEDRVIFQPSVTIDQSPQDVDLDFENLDFNARGGVVLNGWFIRPREARSTLV